MIFGGMKASVPNVSGIQGLPFQPQDKMCIRRLTYKTYEGFRCDNSQKSPEMCQCLQIHRRNRSAHGQS